MVNTYHIHISGIVQGVGFRPFIYRLANDAGFTGTVSNGADGVHIYINADSKGIEDFLNKIVEEAPRLAIITEMLTEVSKAASVWTTRMPRPPPPPAALMITG